jgi:hypothetical protein
MATVNVHFQDITKDNKTIDSGLLQNVIEEKYARLNNQQKTQIGERTLLNGVLYLHDVQLVFSVLFTFHFRTPQENQQTL